jgi:hypothetical protein
MSLALLPLDAMSSAQQPGAGAALVADGPRAVMGLNGTWQVLPVDGLQFNYPPPGAGWKDEPVPLTCLRTAGEITFRH